MNARTPNLLFLTTCSCLHLGVTSRTAKGMSLDPSPRPAGGLQLNSRSMSVSLHTNSSRKVFKRSNLIKQLGSSTNVGEIFEDLLCVRQWTWQ